MSKKKKVKQTKTNVSVGDVKVEEDLYWEGLVTLKNEVAESILKEQQLVLELSKVYAKELEKDKELYDAVKGLILSISDLANDVPPIMNEHMENGKFKEGLVDSENVDGILKYLNIGQQYIVITENIKNLMATAYLDIFTRLSVPTDDLKDVIKKGNENIEKVIEGNINGK